MLESNTLVSYSPKLSYDPAHVKKRKMGISEIFHSIKS
ncbi:hypothetical protein LEP1GSC038_0830 [Leptospira weilii str. 2006001855]|uniref:Uncharacterized protein n=1 Tax=Leptospira weilii str. 2006001855 TaxID=996804 RepID=M6G7G7_9LEPT|nr:hypothetical protein LEP1GSC038_0830 [Leptospira weilii str. 2006001855]